MATTTMHQDLYYDPYDRDILEDPYPMFRRLRDEAPLYYNEPYDFYAREPLRRRRRGLRRSVDVLSSKGVDPRDDQGGLRDAARYVIHEDPADPYGPPQLLARVFHAEGGGPRAEGPRVLGAPAGSSWSGTKGLTVVAELGQQVPIRVFGMLLGHPRRRAGSGPRPCRGGP